MASRYWIIKTQDGEHGNILNMTEKKLSQRVELGDNNNYAIKGFGKESIYMEYGSHVHFNNVLYVPGLKNNIICVSYLEDKGYRVSFVDGKLLVWSKGSSIDDARVIGIRDGILYRIMSQPDK